jgi:hypothetical protein
MSNNTIIHTKIQPFTISKFKPFVKRKINYIVNLETSRRLLSLGKEWLKKKKKESWKKSVML